MRGVILHCLCAASQHAEGVQAVLLLLDGPLPSPKTPLLSSRNLPVSHSVSEQHILLQLPLTEPTCATVSNGAMCHTSHGLPVGFPHPVSSLLLPSCQDGICMSSPSAMSLMWRGSFLCFDQGRIAWRKGGDQCVLHYCLTDGMDECLKTTPRPTYSPSVALFFSVELRLAFSWSLVLSYPLKF